MKLPYGREMGRGIETLGVSFLKHLWPIKYLSKDVQQTLGYESGVQAGDINLSDISLDVLF